MRLQKPKLLLLLAKIYPATWRAFKSHPVLLVPFIIFTVAQSTALYIIYLIPRMPLRTIFGPIVRTLWGEPYLHYPANFLLLPKLNNYSSMILSVILGSFLTGVAVQMVSDARNKKGVRMEKALKSAIRGYLSLFIAVFVFIALFYFSTKLIFFALAKYFLAGHSRLLFLDAKVWLGGWGLTCVNFIMLLLVQSAFIYAIPLLIIDKEKIVTAILKSVLLFKRLFLPTLLLVGVPILLLYLPIVTLLNNAAFLMDRLFPEFILLVLFISAIVNCAVIDPLVTVSATTLFLNKKEEEEA